jgi:mRNA interferase MazF
VACPVTNQIKGYPFEVELPEGLAVQGVVLSDHVRSADWEHRKSVFISYAPTQILDEVRARLKPLLGT